MTLRSCHLTYVGQLNMGRWVPRYTRELVTEHVGVVVQVQGRGHLRGPGSRMSVHVNTGRWVFHHRGWRSSEPGNTSIEPVQVLVRRKVLSTMMMPEQFACPWRLCRHYIVPVVKALRPHPPVFYGVHERPQQALQWRAVIVSANTVDNIQRERQWIQHLCVRW